MGWVKNRMMEEQERGYGFIDDKFVCRECFSDYAVRAFIEDNVVETACSYCGRESLDASTKIAASMDAVMGVIMEGLKTEWADPNDELPWERGWMGEVTDAEDILFFSAELHVESDELRQDILESLGDREWCKKDYFGLEPREILRYGWEAFVRLIKHETRYVFYAVR